MRLPKKPPLLSRSDWDFSNVPVDEIAAACFHEYLRETGLARGLDKPWMSLSPDRRQRLARRYSNFQRRGGEFVPSKKDLEEILHARKPPPFFVRPTGEVKVRWAGYTDTEIVESFRKWLKANRPARTRTKGSGQRRINYQVALERLAVMRLLHLHTPSQLRKLPDWKVIENHVLRRRDQFRERTKAIAFYKKLFSRTHWWGGKPRTWRTAANRARQQKPSIS